MTKLYQLVLALLLPFTLVAQHETAILPLVSFPDPIYTLQHISPATDEAGNTCLYLAYNNKIHSNTVQLLTLSPEGKVLAKSNFQNEQYEGLELLGTLNTPKHFMFCRYNKQGQDHKVLPFLVDKVNGATIPLPDIQINVGKGSKLLTGFVEKNELFMLFYNKKANSIEVVRLDDVGKLNIQHFALAFDNALNRFTNPADLVLKTVQRDISYMNVLTEKSVLATHYQKKVYLQGEKLYFIFDAFINTTEILELDLSKGTSKFSKLPSISGDFGVNFNSYLFQDRIFRLQLSYNYLSLTVFDLHSKEPLATHLYSTEDELTIKSSPVIKSGAATGFESDNKIIEKTSQVLRKMDKGIPAIAVEDVGANTLELTIGSYHVPYNSDGGMIVMGSGNLSTPQGKIPFPTPTMNPSGLQKPIKLPGSDNRKSDTKSYSNTTFFKALISSDNYQKSEVITKKSLQSLADDYEYQLRLWKLDIGTKATYKGNGISYLVYEDKSGSALKVVQLAESAQQ